MSAWPILITNDPCHWPQGYPSFFLSHPRPLTFFAQRTVMAANSLLSAEHLMSVLRNPAFGSTLLKQTVKKSYFTAWLFTNTDYLITIEMLLVSRSCSGMSLTSRTLNSLNMVPFSLNACVCARPAVCFLKLFLWIVLKYHSYSTSSKTMWS